jgi:probable HAF family extracellular repeat protein
MMNKGIFLWVAGVVAVLSAAGPVRAVVLYRVTDLGTLNGAASGATAINDLGQVVGWSGRAFRTGPNQPINPATDDLGSLGGGGTYPWGINNLGQVVGESKLSSNGETHAFRTGPNLAINPATDDLGTLGGDYSSASAINDFGQVVGSSRLTGNGGSHAFRTGPNQRINPATDDLGTLGGSNSHANAINAAGQVVGYSDLPGSGMPLHAFRTSPNSAIDPRIDDLGTFGGVPVSLASAINVSGQVAGLSIFTDLEGKTLMHVFRAAPNQPINLAADHMAAVNGNFGLSVSGMNDRGDIVGAMDDGNDGLRAFVVFGLSMFDLNELIDPGSGWSLVNAHDINNLGQIVGMGEYNGATRAFRLDPIPEPSALGLVGAVGWMMLRRRRWC